MLYITFELLSFLSFERIAFILSLEMPVEAPICPTHNPPNTFPTVTASSNDVFFAML